MECSSKKEKRSSYIRSLKISNKIITLPVDIYNEMTYNFSKVFSDGSEDDFDNIFTLNLEANVSAYKANAVLSDETISRSSQFSTTGVTNVVVCVILSVE